MKRPIVTFIVKDSNREAEYICFLAKILTSREHQKAGFLVLPEPLKDNIYSFCFPDLKYSERFWAAITNTKNKHLGQSFPDEAVHEVIEKISPFETEKNVALKNKIIKDWKGIEDKFFKIYSDFIDVNNTLSKVSSIEVLLTEYGSLGSFYPAKFGSDYKILITKRIDLPADSLIRTILQATIAIKTNISAEIGELPWYYRQTLVDVLLSETMFAKLFKSKLVPTPLLYKNSDELIRKSNAYLEKLGLRNENQFELRSDGELIIDNVQLDGEFTYRETNVLKILIENKNKTVDFDKIAKVVWGRDSIENFSLYTLTKIVENIRRKLRSIGVYKEVICTVRGKGYLLRE